MLILISTNILDMNNNIFQTIDWNASFEKCCYFCPNNSRHGIGFNRCGTFSFPTCGFGCNVKIFGVDMSSSVHVDNKKKDVLILGEGSQQDDTTLNAENKYLVNFSVTRKKII